MKRFVHVVPLGLLGCGHSVTSNHGGLEATVAAQLSRAAIFSVVVGAS